MPDTVASVRVLVADDDTDARALLVEALGSLGHTVVADVGSGREAVEQARSLGPDAVLLDVHMPDVNGIDAATQIASQLPDTAVVLFTGDQTVSLSDEQIVGTSAISMLSKPTPPKTLDSALRLAVARTKALKSAEREANDAKAQLENRKMIERAKGILMRRTGSSEQEAYRILQRTSQDRSVPMIEIAKAVLESEPGYQPSPPRR